MIFNRPLVKWGLLGAVVFGLLAAGLFAVDDRLRKDVVEHGIRTRAVIISDHDNEIDHWFTVSYTVQGEQHSANLRSPWIMDKVREGQELTVYADRTNPDLIATEDGYATPVWTSAPGALAVLALLGVFVAVVEGGRSLRRARRADPRETP
ncbi:hypothetical protein Ate02nite_03450 [Paractinoplanes tereljensis]|uniref:DUF3592 domain-containing protein n=2 Tax=Paractinoplanes tereljensis TaxID=571912 RepID=A0A919TQN8_9ACTN|nr:hypothetical protein Ate02nite_03450 [Actinoplanes tereljensis]